VDDDDLDIDIEDDAAIPPSPWLNADTVAASMALGAATAAGLTMFFQNMAQLALGQSAHEWAQMDREDFAKSVTDLFKAMPEGGEKDGR